MHDTCQLPQLPAVGVVVLGDVLALLFVVGLLPAPLLLAPLVPCVGGHVAAASDRIGHCTVN